MKYYNIYFLKNIDWSPVTSYRALTTFHTTTSTHRHNLGQVPFWTSHLVKKVLVDPRESLRSLNSLDKFVPELLVGLVWREVEPVEAGVCPGVVGGTAPLLYRVQLGAVRSVQLLPWTQPINSIDNSLSAQRYLEPIHRHSAGSCHKLEEAGPHLVAEGEDDPPVPLYHDVVGVVVALVDRVGLPVLDINTANAAHQKLQLSWNEKRIS